MKEMYRVDQKYPSTGKLAVTDGPMTLKDARYKAKFIAEGGWMVEIWNEQANKLIETWKRRKVTVYRVKNMVNRG